MAYDLITVGRVNMDLYSQDIGAAFEDITGFDATVGGSPSNIAIGMSRLGMRTIAFTAVGDDRVGDYVLRYLADEGVVTDFIPRKPGMLTSMALIGVEPPDHFPLSFYREDPADIHLTVEDAAALPIPDTRALLLSGNAFSRGSCVEAARYCAEMADRAGLEVFMDLDLRPSDWSHPAAFGLTLRSVLSMVDVVVGTEEEFYAALGSDPDAVMDGAAITGEWQAGLEDALDELVASGTVETVVLKRGAHGATIFAKSERRQVPGFPVEVVNTVGAGDAFASGLIRSRLVGWDWYESARFANACGAIEVTRHGCSAALPREEEVTSFADEHGGL